MVPFHCVLTWKGLGSSLGLFYKGTNSIHEGSISNPNHLPKAPPPKTITLGIWFHHMSFRAGGMNHSKVGSGLCSQLKYWGAIYSRAFPGASEVENPPAMQEMLETGVQSLGQEDPLEEEMATHSSILAWRIPWKEDPVRLQSMGSQRDGLDWVTELTCMHAIHSNLTFDTFIISLNYSVIKNSSLKP